MAAPGKGAMGKGTKLSKPFHSCVAYIKEANRVLYLSVRGISQLSKSAELVRALANLDHVDEDGVLSEEAQKDVQAAYQIAELAQEEIDNDFPLLHAHTAVAIWTALETTFPRFAAEWLLKFPETLQEPTFAKITVPIGPYDLMSKEERATFVIGELLQIIRFQYLPGVARFEALLDELGISGGVNDDLRRVLYELSHVRNLVVHQFSIVDQRFADECPWVKIDVGERLLIGQGDYERYLVAVTKYLTDVILRVAKKRDTMTKTKVKGKRKAKAAPKKAAQKKAARKAKPPIKTAKK